MKNKSQHDLNIAKTISKNCFNNYVVYKTSKDTHDKIPTQGKHKTEKLKMYK